MIELYLHRVSENYAKVKIVAEDKYFNKNTVLFSYFSISIYFFLRE